MSVNEAVTGIKANDAKALKAELKATLATAKMLAAAWEARLAADGKTTDLAETAGESIKDVITGLDE